MGRRKPGKNAPEDGGIVEPERPLHGRRPAPRLALRVEGRQTTQGDGLSYHGKLSGIVCDHGSRDFCG